MVTHGMLDSLPFYREDGDCERPESAFSLHYFYYRSLRRANNFYAYSAENRRGLLRRDENRLFASL
jgi:hypothetical protein